MINPAQAVADSQHYHISIMVSFLAGVAIHIWAQASEISRKRQGQITVKDILSQNASRTAQRNFVSMCFFLGVWKNPAVLSTLISFMPGVTLSDNVVALLSLPMSLPVAGLWGTFGDVFLGFIPWFKNQLPPMEDFTRVETTEKKTTI